MGTDFLAGRFRICSWHIAIGLLAVLILISIGLWSGANLSSAEQEVSFSLPPDQNPPEYLLAAPLAGKILHWVETRYVFTKDGPDPANGQTTLVELWLDVDSRGVPTKAHIISRFVDGSLHQELLLALDKAVIVFGRGYPKKPPNPNRECKQSWPAYSTEMRLGLMPVFVDETKLPSAGFAPTVLPAPKYPAPKVDIEASPLELFDADQNLDAWEFRETTEGMTHIEQLQIGEHGRVVSSGTKRMDYTGQVIAESRATASPIQVYAPSSVPDRVFTLSSRAAEVCHE